MKRIIILIVACLGLGGLMQAEAMPQEVQTKELTKAERKAIEKREREIHDSIDHVMALDAVNEGYYVVMARTLTMRGYTFPNPQPNMNFVLVQGDKATIQIAFNNGAPGLNGLGGITVEGTISGNRIKYDKKGNAYWDFNVMGPAVSAQVSITLYGDSNSAVATVNPNFGPGDLRISGPLVSYKGYGADNTEKNKK